MRLNENVSVAYKGFGLRRTNSDTNLSAGALPNVRIARSEGNISSFKTLETNDDIYAGYLSSKRIFCVAIFDGYISRLKKEMEEKDFNDLIKDFFDGFRSAYERDLNIADVDDDAHIVENRLLRQYSLTFIVFLSNKIQGENITVCENICFFVAMLGFKVKSILNKKDEIRQLMHLLLPVFSE